MDAHPHGWRGKTEFLYFSPIEALRALAALERHLRAGKRVGPRFLTWLEIGHKRAERLSVLRAHPAARIRVTDSHNDQDKRCPAGALPALARATRSGSGVMICSRLIRSFCGAFLGEALTGSGVKRTPIRSSGLSGRHLRAAAFRLRFLGVLSKGAAPFIVLAPFDTLTEKIK